MARSLRPRVMSPAVALALVATAQVLAISVWFSATAASEELNDRWGLGQGGAGWLTSAVQIGFVVGSLVSASLNLADRWEPRRLIAGSALVAAATTALLIVASGAGLALTLRFACGVALAGVYAPGMKLAASYFAGRRGLALGVVIGGLTLGTGSPQFFKGVSTPSADPLLVAAAISAVVAATIIWFVREGPFAAPAPAFNPRFIGTAVRDRPLRLATAGYLGHMWELYAFWTWLPAFLAASLAAAGTTSGDRSVAIASFVVIGVAGAAGAVAAGSVADRFGRTLVTSVAMAISGVCCLLSPFLYGAAPALLIVFLVVWGAAVIADSGQFSAAVSELADREFVGSALTLQTALGFALTLVSIRVVGAISDGGSWRASLVVLAVGPVLGVVAMLRLRRHPAATRMAGGLR